jgi:hypothetical protein
MYTDEIIRFKILDLQCVIVQFAAVMTIVNCSAIYQLASPLYIPHATTSFASFSFLCSSFAPTLLELL